jgi:hypothetical protein
MIVRVEPSGSVIDVRDGEALMAGAFRSGYRWVLSTAPERRLRPDAVLRLACQFRPGTTDATVVKRGVRAIS